MAFDRCVVWCRVKGFRVPATHPPPKNIVPTSSGLTVLMFYVFVTGGDEWKGVAEALGLSHPEIRFLDNRTLNPLDAALAFIAKQRHITVGELYDLLNEKGFPVIADLL